jgi:hypothetical protein
MKHHAVLAAATHNFYTFLQHTDSYEWAESAEDL